MLPERASYRLAFQSISKHTRNGNDRKCRSIERNHPDLLKVEMEEKELEREVESILRAAGLDLLEFAIVRHKGKIRAKAVIYRKEGTGTEECARAYRLILPRIQMGLGIQDPYLEVYSPGIDRVIRTERDWRAFSGRQIKIMTQDLHEWRTGLLVNYDDGIAVIAMNGVEVRIPVASILKAKLDSMHEGEKADGI